MRALLVCAAPTEGSARLVARLSADADLVIAVDAGADVCALAGVTPDVLVGDLDSASPEVVAALVSAGTEVLAFSAEKDDSDLALALVAARSRGADEVIVTAAASGRLDHTLGSIAALVSAADLRPVLIEPELELFVLSPDARSELLVDGRGSLVSLFAHGATATASATGVRWPLDHAVLSASTTLGLSNVVVSETPARVEVHAGVLLAILPAGESSSGR